VFRIQLVKLRMHASKSDGLKVWTVHGVPLAAKNN